MKNLNLKDKLVNNEITIGSWITIDHPSIIEILANAGFEWLAIDLEHNMMNPQNIVNLIRTIQSYGIAALVRVSKNDEVIIKHVLDGGADGIIVPMVKNRQDALNAIKFAKYPPVGERGVGLSRAQDYGFGFEEYMKWAEENLVIIAQIEHYEGVNNLKSIINTIGIDAVFIGPYDLSSSLGFPGDYDKKEVLEALQIFESVCKDNNFTMGYHIVPPKLELVKNKIESGYKFIAVSTDFFFLANSSYDLMAKINSIK